MTAVVGLFGDVPGQARLGCVHCACRDYCLIRESGTVCYRRPRDA